LLPSFVFGADFCQGLGEVVSESSGRWQGGPGQGLYINSLHSTLNSVFSQTLRERVLNVFVSKGLCCCLVLFLLWVLLPMDSCCGAEGSGRAFLQVINKVLDGTKQLFHFKQETPALLLPLLLTGGLLVISWCCLHRLSSFKSQDITMSSSQR
jgi:hypothetical protein